MSLPTAPEEPPPLTANIVANKHFLEELAVHADPTTAQPKTLVLLHDSCYGHRFSRPKTKQADLNLIVERPERIRAGVMGISAAYVRLGERHAAGRNSPHPKKKPSSQLPFRIQKTSRSVPLTAPSVVAVHGQELMKEVTLMGENAVAKLASTGHEVERSDKAKRSFHTGDLYLCNESLDAMKGALGGVLDAVDAVFEGVKTSQGPSKAFVCIRPPGHHCSSDFPSGFCWINNVHVGIQHAIQQHGLTHAAIIDFDLHHGDGSQEIAWAHNEQMFYPERPTPLAKRPFIGYYSLHDINSFPCEGGDREKVQNASLCIDNAHGQSIWNEHLKPWKTEPEFWSLYESKYKILLEKARTFLNQQTEERLKAKGNNKPKAAIFISAGFDASEHEGGGMQRHKVNVPTEFYARFTKDIVALANETSTAAEGRVISVLEGGYSNRALISGILSHVSGLCYTSETEDDEASLISGMATMGLSGLPAAQRPPKTSAVNYTTDWWDTEHLEILEHLIDPHPVVPVPGGSKKVRLATYSSPTQASTLKAYDPSKVHLGYRVPSSASPSRPTTPPPPEVDWDVAASELCALLIPTDRETRSYTGASLAEPKIKKEKPEKPVIEAIAMPPPPIGGRTLRDRKTKVVSPTESKPATARKASIDRRKTIAEALPKFEDDSIAAKEPRRRLSAASTISTASVAPPSRPRVTKTASNGLDIKKSRGSSAQPSKPPPTARVVSSGAPSVPARVSSTASQSTVMDDLASNIKKINIKVPSNEEYASRQKKTIAPGAAKPTVADAAPRRTSGVVAGPKKAPVTKPALTSRRSSDKKSVPASKTTKPSPPVPKVSIVIKQSPPTQVQPVEGRPQPQWTHNSESDSTAVGSQRASSVTPSLSDVNSDTPQQSWIQEAPETAQAAQSIQSHTYPQIQWMSPNSDLPKQQGETDQQVLQAQRPQPAQEPNTQVQQVQGPQTLPAKLPPTFTATGHIPFSNPYQ
jgi:histone deacetylase HOS3